MKGYLLDSPILFPPKTIYDSVGTDIKSHKMFGNKVWLKNLQKLFKSLPWPIEAGVTMAGSQMKYLNHSMNSSERRLMF